MTEGQRKQNIARLNSLQQATEQSFIAVGWEPPTLTERHAGQFSVRITNNPCGGQNRNDRSQDKNKKEIACPECGKTHSR